MAVAQDPINEPFTSYLLDFKNFRQEQKEAIDDVMKILRQTPEIRSDRWELVQLFQNKAVRPPSDNGYLMTYVLFGQPTSVLLDIPSLGSISITFPTGVSIYPYPVNTRITLVTAPVTPAYTPVWFLFSDKHVTNVTNTDITGVNITQVLGNPPGSGNLLPVAIFDAAGHELGLSATGNQTVIQGNASAGGIATQWGILVAQKNAHIAVGAGNTVVKNSAGNLCAIIVNIAGTTGFTVFDNASTNSGTSLYTSKTAPALGDIYLILGGAAVNGIVVANTATGPDLTAFYS